jgi:hypothetical protein
MTTKRKLLICGVAAVAVVAIVCLGVWLQLPESVYTLIAGFVAIVILMPLFGSKKPQ